MCAIAGCLVFSKSDFNISDSYLTSIRDTMIHRGPDGGLNWINSDLKIGLAHRRLSILDLSDTANQPMSNHDDSIFIVFNGEIYNHSEIKSELLLTGKYLWKTNHSDTEVIIHAYEEWGIECLHKFRGMFSFALWDCNSKDLFLVRDRIGIKPLYYSIHNERIVFASEIKALLKDPKQVREVNEKGLFNYLTFLTVPAPETLFKGIYKIPAGCYMKIRPEGEFIITNYYELLDHLVTSEHLDEKNICDSIVSGLRESVKYRKVSDVPVGVFLSGGIDSSTNASLFSEDHIGEVKTFSVGYDNDYVSYKSELHYAKSVAQHVGAKYFEYKISENDFSSFLPKMIEFQDEPLGDPVCVPLFFVSKLARENNVVVCQVGEGADELFFGYPGWMRNLKVNKLNDIPFLFYCKKLIYYILKYTKFRTHGYFEYLRRAIHKQPLFWSGADVFTQFQKMNILSERLKKKFNSETSYNVIDPIWKNYCQKANQKDIINWMAYVDLKIRLPELLLMRVDKMTMGVSLEARVPFLDHKFVELAMGIPGNNKYKHSTLKYLLKKAVRGIIPDEVIDRKKQGFGAPIKEWYDGDLGAMATKTLYEFCSATDYLDWKSVKKILDSNDKTQSWPLLNLALWWNHYIRDNH